ncbi:MAG: hypothetical protein WC841_00400 [Candidatus Shapirobacteria bacterium]|jgi:hypothetical protein
MSSKFLVVLIFLLFFTRFIKLDWGNGYYFHPDENNMASAISRLSPGSLDPKFYAYGQFPLFLAFYSFRFYSLLLWNILPDHLTFSQSILTLRFWSAIFSTLSVLVFYLISKKITPKKYFSEIFAILLIFSPGLIQFSHFGTTESILIFVLAINTLLGLLILDSKGIRLVNLVIASSLINAAGLATKITSVILIGPVLLALLLLFIRSRNKVPIILLTQLFTIITIVLYAAFSPFNIVSRKEFLSTMGYETAVATGKIPVFYTSQFIGTRPYIYQFIHIFPYVNGLPVFLIAILGIILFIKKFPKPIDQKYKWLIVLATPLIYFLYVGQLYTKWTRFMSPIFFIFPLLTAYFISSLRPNGLKIIFTLICVIPGFVFLYRYLQKDIRVTASEWVDKNIPEKSIVLSEAGNVINFPMGTTRGYDINNFDFYKLDEDPNLPPKLTDLVSDADYIFVPSRRIFKNQYGPRFPHSDKYYRRLFSGALGFRLIKTFPADLVILNPENAEETWTVFDRPVIRIFQKVNGQAP